MGQVTRAVFLDLTAAYDTVRFTGLHLKIQKAISCSKTTDLIMYLLYNGSFVLFAGGKASKPYKLKNCVAQESILAPTLNNIYTSDFLSTSCKRCMYADDVALTCSDNQTVVIEHTISKDVDCVSKYYRKWHLKLSTTKSVCSIFHLKNHLAQYQLQVYMSGNSIPFVPTPRYLGVTLNRSLTFRQQIEKLKNKMTSRVALVKRLAGLNWGACFNVLRVSTLSLVAAPAEYCSPVWNQSSHTNKLNTPFNEALRTISGCIKPTHISFLPFLAGI